MYHAGILNNGLIPSGGYGRVAAPGLEKRMEIQNARVLDGLQDGTISSDEQEALKLSEEAYEEMLQSFKADDGKVDSSERSQLHEMLNGTSEQIYEDKHNQDATSDSGSTGQADSSGGIAPNPKESFSASITGDPHFSVDGTINGQEVSSSFDNQDLGTRTQYQGAGFELSTNTVPWGDGGAAVVNSATVNTGFGKNKDSVTVNADGSVLLNGAEVSLDQGQNMQLNATSSLTMNEDGTYTVSSRNGKVTNTFSINESDQGNYLNINANVDNVQSVGWLEDQVA